MSSSINVVFNADTGQYVQNIENGTKATIRSAESVAKAKNDIIASFKMQIQAAKEVGASHQELEAIQRKAATMMASVSETNAERIVNSLDRISAKNKQVALELGALKIASPLPSGGGHEVSDRMAASATVRGLENGNPGIRSIENFITTIPGAAVAMQALFPIIGAAGLAGLFVDMGIKGYEAFQKIQKSAETLRNSFDEFNAPQILNVDSLRKANDELEISIAHLEHKPANVLALALDEARINADRLASSASKAATDVKKLLDENKVGFTSFLVSGQTSTGPVSDEINKRMTALRDLQRENRDALHSGHDTPEAAAARETKIRNQTSSLATWAHGSRTDIQSFNQNGKNNANINALSGIEDYASSSLDEMDEQKRNVGDQQKQKQLQDADKLRQQATEAQRKAAEKQRQQWDIEHDQWEQATQRSAADEVGFWTAKVNSVGIGSANYKDALDKQTEAIKAQRTKDAEAAKQSASQALKDQRTAWDLDHDSWTQAAHRTASDEAGYWAGRLSEAELGSDNYKSAYDKFTVAILASQREAEAAQKARNKASQEQSQQAAAYALATVAIQQQTGQISRQDAALQTANIHAEQYRQQMALLQDELKQQQKLDPNSAATINAQSAITKASADRNVQIMQDAAANAAATWQGALKNANANWVQDSQDSSKQVVELYQQGLSGLNANISDLMIGKKSNFSGMFQGIGKTLGTDALKHVEAPVLGALGIGKADGSASNPFNVKVVDGIGNFASGAAQGLHGLFSKSGDSGSDDSSSGGFGGFLKGAVGFIGSIFGGHKALGGNVQAGVTYDVGEMGREEFTPSTNGTITPHNQINSGAATYNVSVANGVTPEQMNAYVQSTLRQYHSTVAHTSVKANQDDRSRNPASHR